MRGRKPRQLPPFIENRPEDNLVRCHLCLEHNCFTVQDVWIQKRSLTAHITGVRHRKSKAIQEEKEKETRETEAMIQRNTIEALAQIHAESRTIGVTQGHTVSTRQLKSRKVKNGLTAAQVNAEAEFWKEFDAGIDVDFDTF